MKKAKVLFTMILAGLLVSCGGTPTSSNSNPATSLGDLTSSSNPSITREVTAQQWEEIMVNSGSNFTMEVYLDGTLDSVVLIKDDVRSQVIGEEKEIVTKENDSYFQYFYTNSSWTKRDIEEETYMESEVYLHFLSTLKDDYSHFTFANDVYKASSLDKSDVFNGVIENVVIAFKNKNIESLSFEFESNYGKFTYEVSNVGTTDIVIPLDYVDKTSRTLTTEELKLLLLEAEDKEYTKLIRTRDGVTETYIYGSSDWENAISGPTFLTEETIDSLSETSEINGLTIKKSNGNYIIDIDAFINNNVFHETLTYGEDFYIKQLLMKVYMSDNWMTVSNIIYEWDYASQDELSNKFDLEKWQNALSENAFTNFTAQMTYDNIVMVVEVDLLAGCYHFNDGQGYECYYVNEGNKCFQYIKMSGATTFNKTEISYDVFLRDLYSLEVLQVSMYQDYFSEFKYVESTRAYVAENITVNDFTCSVELEFDNEKLITANFDLDENEHIEIIYYDYGTTYVSLPGDLDNSNGHELSFDELRELVYNANDKNYTKLVTSSSDGHTSTYIYGSDSWNKGTSDTRLTIEMINDFEGYSGVIMDVKLSKQGNTYLITMEMPNGDNGSVYQELIFDEDFYMISVFREVRKDGYTEPIDYFSYEWSYATPEELEMYL